MDQLSLQTLLDAESAMDHATDHYSDTKQRIARLRCPHSQGTSTDIVWRNRDAKLMVDTVIVRKRKSDGLYEWVAAGYVFPEGRTVRSNYRTEITGLITE